MAGPRGAALLGILVVVYGCAGSASKRGGSENYVNREIGVSLRVPSDWGRAGAWRSIGKPGFVTSFESPAGDATVTIGRAAFAGIDCGAAARAAVKEVTGASVATTAEFEVAAGTRGIPAGQGTSAVGDRQGEVRYFCHDKTTVVVEASAPRASYGSNRKSLVDVLDSVSFVTADASVAVRAPEIRSEPAFFVHVVKYKGETLAAIVEWYTGTPDNWRVVARANDGDFTVPNAPLKIGRDVRIPSELMIRQEPMPRPKQKTTVQRPPKEPKIPKTDPPAEPQEDVPLPSVIGPR